MSAGRQIGFLDELSRTAQVPLWVLLAVFALAVVIVVLSVYELVREDRDGRGR